MPGCLLLPHGLMGHACILVLACCAAFVSLKWGRAACEALHRFIVLFRHIPTLLMQQLS